VISGALRSGRWLEASRRLSQLEAAGAGAATHYLDQISLRRMRRVVSRYKESLEELQPAAEGGWTAEPGVQGGMDFAYRLVNSTVQVVCSAVFDGADAFQAFVGLTEWDLCGRFCEGFREAQELQHKAPGDSLWRVLRQAPGGSEDNILHVSCLDALDEQLGALWVSAYVPEELACPANATSEESSSAELRSVSLPPAKPGAARLGFWRASYAIVPLWRDGPSGAFRLMLALSHHPTRAARAFPSFARREADTLIRNLRLFLDTCRELNWRALFSDHAEMYDFVRRHLAQKAPPTSLPPSPLSRLKFSEFSMHLPPDWADYCEPVCAY